MNVLSSSGEYAMEIERSISESKNKPYKLLQSHLDPELTSKRVSLCFDDFLKKYKDQPLLNKVFLFQIVRYDVVTILLNELPVQLKDDIGVRRSMFDYFDFLFANLFFRGLKNENPLHEKLDNDFYYVLLPHVIDKIEFPTLIDSELRHSLSINNRDKYPLNKKNRLSIYYTLSQGVHHNALAQYVNKYRSYPSKKKQLGILKTTKRQFFKRLDNQFSFYNKELKSNKTKDEKLIVYRGYDISDDENVIINRKIRTQDANKSFSFTTNTAVAMSFSNYKINKMTDEDATTFDDRVNLASAMFDIENYRKKENRKFILAKYEIDIKDVICTPLQTTITEYEVFAYPEKAKLLRYQIVNSTSTN